METFMDDTVLTIFKHHKNKQYILDNLKTNLLCHTIGVVCLCLIAYYTDKEYMNVFLTFLIVSYLGYMVHYWSHTNNLCHNVLHSESKIAKYIRENKVVKSISLFLLSTFDFHSIIHHDTSINKYPMNWLGEFIFNVFYQGGLLCLILYYLIDFKINIFGHKFALNKKIALFWAVLYASFHNINYNILGEQNHIDHHIYADTNLGPDIYDIMGNTKYDLKNTENYNHISINIIAINSNYYRIL